MAEDSDNSSVIMVSRTRALAAAFDAVSVEAVNGLYAYLLMMVIGGSGNVVVLITLLKQACRVTTAMNLLLMNLALADLLVIFSISLSEIVWRFNVGWPHGDFYCKSVNYLRGYGLYLSSSLIVCISLNRYYTIIRPQTLANSKGRLSLMIGASWILSAVFAAPQVLLFHTVRHPLNPNFYQCLSNAWGETGEIANGVLSNALLFIIPLGFIIYTYGNICYKVVRDKSIAPWECDHPPHSHQTMMTFRCTWTTTWDRARTPSTKTAVGIVVVFLVCWTPYCMASSWYLLHRQSLYQAVDPKTHDFLLAMVVATSALNPFVYGLLARSKREQFMNGNRNNGHWIQENLS